MAWKAFRAERRSSSALPALWLLVLLSTLMRAATHLGGKRIAVRATTPGAAWTRAARARIRPRPWHHSCLRAVSSSSSSTTSDSEMCLKVENVDDLWRLSSYFSVVKDNTTQFFRAERAYESAVEAVVEGFGVTEERARMLHAIGAVYVLRDRPRRTVNLPGEVPIEPKEVIRLHTQPRRFPGCFVDYRDRVRYEDEDFLVVDKPAGCPCSLHVSNAVDCLDRVVSASLQRPPLIRLNRLDVMTTGVVTLAKTKQAAAAFQEELRRNRIHKVYRALLLGPVPTGVLEHYMPNDILHRRPAPRAISTVAHPEWKICQCEVLSCTPLTLPHMDPSRPEQVYHEVEVALITGRTHQLRAQFSAAGSPIACDDMYIPLKGYLFNDLEDPTIFGLYPLAAEPASRHGIALQCSGLRFLDVHAQAGDPWWRALGPA